MVYFVPRLIQRLILIALAEFCAMTSRTCRCAARTDARNNATTESLLICAMQRSQKQNNMTTRKFLRLVHLWGDLSRVRFIQRAGKLRHRHRAKFDIRKDANKGLEISGDLFSCSGVTRCWSGRSNLILFWCYEVLEEEICLSFALMLRDINYPAGVQEVTPGEKLSRIFRSNTS